MRVSILLSGFWKAMRIRRSSTVKSLALPAIALMLSGCHRGGGSFLLNVLSGTKPLSLALVTERPLQLNPFGRYERLRQELENHVNQPVRIELCVPFQLDFHLNNGFCQFAFVSPVVYAGLADRERFPVLAVATDVRGRTARPAFLVVRADSAVQSVQELRGARVAFGPADDGRTHAAALEMLGRHGVSRDDLKKELLPIPGLWLKHLSDGEAVADSVWNGSSDAGFIDQADWERMFESGDKTDALSSGDFRILARTRAVPDVLLIASPKADPAMVESVRAFMLAVGKLHAAALEPLGQSGYQRADDASLAAWIESVGGKRKK